MNRLQRSFLIVAVVQMHDGVVERDQRIISAQSDIQKVKTQTNQAPKPFEVLRTRWHSR